MTSFTLQSGQPGLLLSSRRGVVGSAIPVVVISGSVRVAVIVAPWSLSQPCTIYRIPDPSSHGCREFRLTVIVRVVIGITVGLTPTGGRSIVSAAVVVALVGNVSQCLITD